MKYFAQFFNRSVINPNEIIEACGDRAVIILDGRLSKQTMGEIAAQECEKRGYVAWQVHQGNFARSNPVSGVWYVHKNEPVHNPCWLSAHN